MIENNKKKLQKTQMTSTQCLTLIFHAFYSIAHLEDQQLDLLRHPKLHFRARRDDDPNAHLADDLWLFRLATPPEPGAGTPLGGGDRGQRTRRQERQEVVFSSSHP